jgi:hypothetical protein
MNPDSVSRAIVVWTGWGVRTWPQRQDAAVLEVFGPSEGPSILVRVKELASEFYVARFWPRARLWTRRHQPFACSWNARSTGRGRPIT